MVWRAQDPGVSAVRTPRTELVMRRSAKRKSVVAAAVLFGTFTASSLAFGYWTLTGSGTATATMSSGATVTLAGTIPAGLGPGVDQTVTLKATPSKAESVHIGTVHLASIDVDAGHATCDVSWFSMADVVANEDTPASTSQYTLTATGTLHMIESG